MKLLDLVKFAKKESVYCNKCGCEMEFIAGDYECPECGEVAYSDDNGDIYYEHGKYEYEEVWDD